jgi:hypothetical protein
VSDSEFNLQALTWELLREPGEVERSKIVAELLNRIKPADRDEALAQALPAFVSLQETKFRRRTSIEPDNVQTAERVGDVRRLPVRSAKRERIAEWWRHALEEKYATATPGVLKSFGDMDRDDLIFAIRSREETARRTAAKATALRGVLDLLERHEVARVRDLPEAVLAAVLVKAA